jgi:lipoate-protein ligase A
VPRRWRLLLDGPAAGTWNMGVDEALLASAAEGGVPTLRLYAWQGPWLSLGYGQRVGAERLAACAGAGVGVVRRASGGLAVLHGADLTYAVAAPERLLPAGLRPTYETLAAALLAALRALGVDAQRSAAATADAGPGGFDCFAEPAADELCVGGRKLVGSAQRRGGGGVLQHGSLRLAPDPGPARCATGLGGAGATSLQELGCRIASERLHSVLIEAFGAALDAQFERGVLTLAETALAAQRGADPLRAVGRPAPGDSQDPSSTTDRY